MCSFFVGEISWDIGDQFLPCAVNHQTLSSTYISFNLYAILGAIITTVTSYKNNI